MVEQGTENPRVGSSILSLGTREYKGLQLLLQAFFVMGFGRSGARTVRGPCPSGCSGLPPPFPVFRCPVFVPVHGRLVPALRGALPMVTCRPSPSVLAAFRSSAPVPYVRQRRSPRPLVPPLPPVPCHVSPSGTKAGRRRPPPSRSCLSLAGVLPPAAQAAASQAGDMSSPPKIRTGPSCCHRCSRSRTAAGP